MEIPLINYSNLPSAASTSFATVATVIAQSHHKCFTFKTMRGNDQTVIVDREEWDMFLKFVGATPTDRPPCK